MSQYEIVETIDEFENENGSGKLLLVKLDTEIMVRMTEKEAFGVTDHVLLGIATMLDVDGNGRNYQETKIIASCGEGHAHDGNLYFAPRAMEVDEAMFAIGALVKPKDAPASA